MSPAELKVWYEMKMASHKNSRKKKHHRREQEEEEYEDSYGVVGNYAPPALSMDPGTWDLGNPKGPELGMVVKQLKVHVYQEHKWSSQNKWKIITEKVLDRLIKEGKTGFSFNGDSAHDEGTLT